MLRNIAKFEQKINGRDFTFLCENDSPLLDCKEFHFQCLKYIGQIEDQAKANQEKLQSEASAQEVSNPSVG